MITIEEKLSVFTKLVLEKVQKEYDDALNKMNMQNNHIIQGHKMKLQKQGEKIIEEMIKKGEIEKNKMIAKAILDKKRKIRYKMQELIERQIEEIKKKGLAFTDKKAYRDFLKDSLFKILENIQEDTVILLYLTKKDIRRHKLFLLKEAKAYGFSEGNIEILPYKEDFIGGIIAFDKNKTFRMDLSILTKIEENKNFIGKSVYEAFKKMGDAYE